MNTETKKKSLLAVGIAVISTAMPLLVEGVYLEGGILLAIGAGLVVGYDVLDDRMKGTPQLPAGIDEEYFRSVADYLADEARDPDDERDA
ncbi:hypothetical protein Z052_02105 [Halorubrum sp. C191]|uniref:hypothetical protein n=1 Tax=Halorubrum sp. C191 TaxID=1383842 RepID=UPI000C122485|nr:hypothetical protein [Halorubrum sp. C191]PHQ43956.1 hypothetical protein Z052_02105 [Halorubrum sp. C191]